MIFVLRSGGAFSVQGPEGVFIGGNTFLGLALNMVVPVLICLARDEKDKRLRLFLNFAAASCAVASVFTYSRGALIGLVVVLPLLFMKSPRKAWGSMIFLLAAVWLVVYMAPEGLWRRAQTIQTYEEDLSAMARLRSWSVAWNIAKDRPLTGAGFQFEYSSDRARWFSYADERFKGMAGGTQSAHSAYFQVLGQHGFIALGLYLLVMASTIITLRNLGKRARAAPGTDWIATYSDGLRIGIIAFAISGAFLNAAYFDLYYIFIGLTAILSREFSSAQVPVHVAVPSVATASPSQGLEDARRI
jgi:putative inorganic carbon (hco3(-)) transporter